MIYMTPMFDALGQEFWVPRSGKWPTVRRRWLDQHSTCAACGRTETPNVKLEVHHVMPVHLDPAKELDESNFMTLCQSMTEPFGCHLFVGHLLNWRSYNPTAREDAASFMRRIQERIKG